MTGAGPHVLIVGAGIIGASIAWHAARLGARVTIIEAAEPGGIATRQSLAWINASWGNAYDYFRLRQQAMADWRRLERALPAIRVGWVGGLLWDLPAERLRAFAVEHRSWGYDIRLVDRDEAMRIEPRLAEPPELAVHVASEGAVEPLAASRALLAGAQDLGARLVTRTPVRAIAVDDGRARGIVTDGGRVDGDVIVVAAGGATPLLAATTDLALAVDTPANLLVTTTPHQRLLNGLVMAPHLHIRQTEDARFMAVTGVTDRDPDSAARSLLDAMGRLFRNAPALSMASHALARRPIPKGGLPIVGHADAIEGLYIAVTHSAITLAPAIGRLAAEELVRGSRDPLLAPYGVQAHRERAT